VVVLKRGQGKGFSGLENPLFFKDVTGMLYGDAKRETLTKADRRSAARINKNRSSDCWDRGRAGSQQM